MKRDAAHWESLYNNRAAVPDHPKFFARWGERLVATFLSLYVLAAFVVLGSGLGAAVLWYYDEI